MNLRRSRRGHEAVGGERGFECFLLGVIKRGPDHRSSHPFEVLEHLVAHLLGLLLVQRIPEIPMSPISPPPSRACSVSPLASGDRTARERNSHQAPLSPSDWRAAHPLDRWAIARLSAADVARTGAGCQQAKLVCLTFKKPTARIDGSQNWASLSVTNKLRTRHRGMTNASGFDDFHEGGPQCSLSI